jgi:hypothetical protein
MSAFTNRVYASWLGQNGLTGLRRRPTRGMGGMPPMQAQQRPFTRSAAAGDAVACPGVLSRPEKQKEIPASATNTPGIVTTVKGTNDDGTHCRP